MSTRRLSDGEAKRLSTLKAMKAARCKPDGVTPNPGYAGNVAAIAREIAELERRGTVPQARGVR